MVCQGDKKIKRTKTFRANAKRAHAKPVPCHAALRTGPSFFTKRLSFATKRQRFSHRTMSLTQLALEI